MNLRDARNQQTSEVRDRAHAAAAAAAAKSLQSCVTLCDPIVSRLPGSSVHGIFQARVLEWGALPLSVVQWCPNL